MRGTIEVRLIIWPRGADSGKTGTADSAGCGGQRTSSARGGTTDVWGGFCIVPCTGGSQWRSLWIGRRSPDVCGFAEKWESAIHLRPACARELCQCAVPAFSNEALLVSAPASGAAYGYLRRISCTRAVASSRSGALFVKTAPVGMTPSMS